MTEPSEFDYRIGEGSAEKNKQKWNDLQNDYGNKWVAASLKEVENNVYRAKGDVTLVVQELLDRAMGSRKTK